MIDGRLVYEIALLAVGVVVLCGALGQAPWRRVLLLALLIAYVAWIAEMTLFPIPVEGKGPVEQLASAINRPNLVPLRSIVATAGLPSLWEKTRLLAGNVLVFVPLGLILPALTASMRSWWRVALAGIAFSLAVELSQLGISLALGYWYRMFDVDDVLLNVCGVLLGYAWFAVAAPHSQAGAGTTAVRPPTRRG